MGIRGRGGITQARFTMRATVLRQLDNYNPNPVSVERYGHWVRSQDPLTKEIVSEWAPYKDEPSTPLVNESAYGEIPCLARGIDDGGVTAAGSTERFGSTYDNIEIVRFWTPSNVTLTKRDRITNIKDAEGRIRWRDEEYEDSVGPRERDVEAHNSSVKATVFSVNGVIPLFDARNIMVEQFILLHRAEVSGDSDG